MELQEGQFAALERAAEPVEDILWPREGQTEVWVGRSSAHGVAEENVS